MQTLEIIVRAGRICGVKRLECRPGVSTFGAQYLHDLTAETAKALEALLQEHIGRTAPAERVTAHQNRPGRTGRTC